MFFTATENIVRLQAPFLEDARANFAPYYTTSLSIPRLQTEVSTELAKLGGMVLTFREGFFEMEGLKRYGYVIEFLFQQTSRGEIRVAGLPIRRETPAKVEQVKKQALAIVRDQLKASVTSRIFNPGYEPLIQFLLVDGQKTLTDYLMETHQLPPVNPSLPLLTGEVV